jgi:hypothetical protein
MSHNSSWNADDRWNRFHKGNNRLLDDAITNLRASLKPSLWRDDAHLSDTNGDTVFDREQDVVDDLIQLIGNRWDETENAHLQSLIDQLLEADRSLAETAIADAAAAHNDPKKINKANKALTKGDTALENGRFLRAMWKYQQAWGFAITS